LTFLIRNAVGQSSGIAQKLRRKETMKAFGLIVSLSVITGMTVTSASAETPEESIARIENEVAQAIINRDIKVLEERFADDFIGYGPTTLRKTTKTDIISAVKSGDYVVTAFKYPPFTIRVFGSTV
jgi:protein-disulfide isomerase